MGSLFANLLQDTRYGVRNLSRNPGFVAIALVTLALGIGANATIFSVLNGTLLKPLSFPNPNSLMLVFETFGKGPDNWNIVSAPNFWDLQKRSHSFESMAILDSAGRGYNLSTVGTQEPEQVSGLRVSSGFFTVLGVKPMLGRTFLPEEELLGRDREVVLSYGLWKNRYAGDPGLVGRSIRIDGADFVVVGVMPPDFQWQFEGPPRQLWVPVGYTKTDYGRGDNSFLSIARLKPGVTQAQATAELESIAGGLRKEYPAEDVNMGAIATPLSDFGLEGLRGTLFTLSAAVAFVLLIACVNVANLLLARGAARQKEPRNSSCPRGQGRPHRAPAYDRKHAPGLSRRSLRIATCLLGRPRPALSIQAERTGPSPAASRIHSHRCPSVGVRLWCCVPDRSAIRHRTSR